MVQGPLTSKCCLHPSLRLRTQLFLSFGLTAIVSIASFVSIGLYTASNSGQSVQQQARSVVSTLVQRSLSSTAQYVAETMTKKFNTLGGAGSLLSEITRDRFVGYPSAPGWEDDRYVPFRDSITGNNMYPINMTMSLKLDWQIEGNVNFQNQHEHLPNRPLEWYAPILVDTQNAAYFMQGSCDPTLRGSNLHSPQYYPACTDAHNNVRTGGVVQPTSTNYALYQKSKDISWALKALYEVHTDVKQIGIFFANSGAGSTVQYPATVYDGRGSYESIGCDWMYTVHPASGRFVAPLSQIERCHPAGTQVDMREYNPLERAWCRDQVQHSIDLAAEKASLKNYNMKSTGPYLDALSAENLWVLTFGQAVFDRMTQEFIACTLVDVSVEYLYQILVGSSNVGASSEAALVRFDEAGTVIVASQWNPTTALENGYVTDDNLGLGVSPEDYNKIRTMVDYSQPWDPEQVKQLYQETILEANGRLIMVHPVPNVPDEYDPLYYPEYLVAISIEEDEAYGLLDQMDQTIEDDVTETWKNIGIVGGVGFGVVCLSIYYIAWVLTKPLNWMQRVAGLIIDNAGGTNMKEGLAEELNNSDAKPFCAPRTEVTKLQAAFENMINDFSGDGAAEVAGFAVNEVRNGFEWRPMYEDIYPWESKEEDGGKHEGTKIPRQLSITKTKQDDVFDDELTTESTAQQSVFSILHASVRQSVVNSQYASTLDSLLTRTTSMINSVRDVAVSYGAKYGLLEEPEEERIEGPPFVNRGQNIKHPKDASRDYFDGVGSEEKSQLFWYTSFLVGAPIIITAVIISVSVGRDTTRFISEWMADVREASYDIEKNAIDTANTARAFFGEEVMQRFIRDLHLYSRLTGWLLFGAVARSNSFTQSITGADVCKEYDPKNPNITCPFILGGAENYTACDCAWNDEQASSCTDFDGMDTRSLQYRFWEGQSDDADMFGTRMETSWPEVAFYPNATNWWNNSQTIPVSLKGNGAVGYGTTYDRVRVTSALSLVEMPIYNYNPGVGEKKNLGLFVAFEYDGMMTGYTGCSHGHAIGWPHWQSTEGNRAAKTRPELCPEGKYGYDARCRGWFQDGKTKGGVHITPPYQFASTDIFAGSATFSLVDPMTNAHVGQVLLDFLPDAFMRSLDSRYTRIGSGTSGFPVVITAKPDASGADVLVGPGYSLGMSASISDIVLPYDERGSPNQLAFEDKIVSKMRAGETGKYYFIRTNAKGKEETVYFAFAPLTTQTLQPLNASDFSRGVNATETLLYSIGFGITLSDLILPFDKVEDKVNSDIEEVNFISLALILASVIIVLYVTYTMSVYISEPILVLYGIVKSIERKNIQDELPRLPGGSSELFNVYDSLEKLCKIVRFSNAAFFKGDRARSYKVMEDALDLFNDIGNQKALGVANNNLGTMVLQEQMERSSATVRSNEVYFSGMKYFEEAIRIGTYEYQNAEFDDTRGDYVKQLANRYFNRGMFYIVNRTHPMAPSNLEEMGIKDLKRAKALDEEAFLYWRERGMIIKFARTEFGCLLRRARGMLTLIQDADFQDVWGIKEVIDRADAMLENPDFNFSTLFEGVNLTARRQQVNDLRIQHLQVKGDMEAAAKIAIRILVEDEYIVDTVIMNCATTLNKYYNLQGDMQVPNLATGVKRDTRRGAVDSMRQAKNVIFCLDYSGSMAGERMACANKNLLWVYEEHCLDKDYVGFVRFNHAVDEKLYFDLGRKGENQATHVQIMEQATDAEGGTRLYAALHKCVNMAVEVDNNYDCWIIALTDGESAWDFPAKQVISRIEKHNKSHSNKINVVVIGYEVSVEVAESVEGITNVTDQSLYIDAHGGLDEMDNAFEHVAALITGTAITMETF